MKIVTNRAPAGAAMMISSAVHAVWVAQTNFEALFETDITNNETLPPIDALQCYVPHIGSTTIQLRFGT